MNAQDAMQMPACSSGSGLITIAHTQEVVPAREILSSRELGFHMGEPKDLRTQLHH